MSPAGDLGFPRRLFLLASVVLGLLLLFDLGLFGWLIFRSLSQREIEEALIETRQEAEDLAARIAEASRGDGDLYTAVSAQTETLTSIDSILEQREFVYEVAVRDRDGILVFHARTEAEIDLGGDGLGFPRDIELDPELGRGVEVVSRTWEDERQVAVPIGDLGFLHIGISPGMLEQRIGVLRGELVRQTATVGTLTLVMLLLAYAGIWWLWRRGRRLEEQAAEAERMAYIGTLASGLAHEIRNPLNSLNLNMQMLEEDLSDGSNRRLLDITRSEIGRLERLVTDFLSYARPRPLEREELPAVELARRARQVLEPQIRAQGARMTVEDDSGGARVGVDPAQMGQLLLNLLHNALAAVEGRGKGGRVRLVVRRRGEQVVLEVADNGVGIPLEQHERIFELFYSTRRGGTGLGLAIVQRIARAHDAELEVESEPGRGTTVRVVLAAAPGETGAALPRPALDQPPLSSS